MKEAELENKLSIVAYELNKLLEIIDRSNEDIVDEFNEDSLKVLGKKLFDEKSASPLKLGLVRANIECMLRYIE